MLCVYKTTLAEQTMNLHFGKSVSRNLIPVEHKFFEDKSGILISRTKNLLLFVFEFCQSKKLNSNYYRKGLINHTTDFG